MSYLQFHAVFNFPLLLLLLWLNAWGLGPGEWMALAAVLAVVVIFTSPWDNLAAKWGIWGFPRNRFTFAIGYLPIEEYLFFVLQSVNVMLATRAVLLHLPDWRTGLETPIGPLNGILALILLLAWAGVGWYLWRNRPARRYNYAVHLLFWFLPIIPLQWAIAPGLLSAHAALVIFVTLAFGAYYTLADIVAVYAGTWHFDETQITGWRFLGILPWEEIAFFFLTSWLVVQSYLLLLPASAR